MTAARVAQRSLDGERKTCGDGFAFAIVLHKRAIAPA